MKQILALLSSLLLLGSCADSGKGRLTVRIAGLPDDSLIFAYVTPGIIRSRGEMVRHLVGSDGTSSDSVKEFTIDMPDDGHVYRTLLLPQSYRGDGPKQTVELFLLPGERNVTVDGTYEPRRKTIEYTIGGSPVQEAWLARQKEIESIEMRLGMLGTASGVVSAGTATGDSIRREMQILADSITRIKARYVGSNPGEQLSGYYLTTIGDPRIVDSLYRLLGDNVKNGPLKEWLDLQNEEIAKVLTAQQARTAMAKDGAAVPDFTLPDAKGGKFTLSSLYGQGKYIVLDFWGTWCGWCIKGMPKMKETYASLGGGSRVEFVGIDCGDTETKWKDAVKTHQLPWINVRAEGDDIPMQYGVEAFPTKIILGPDGKVAARFTGEAPAFHATLDSLVNKR